MDDQQPTTVGRKRNKGAATTGRAAALERLRALRRGERRSDSSYQVKIEEPIYDVVDEDQYKNIVAGRRDEFGDFIVDDEENGGTNLGYRDDGEEEDWTQAGFGYSDIESEGEESERLKKRKKPEKKEKDLQQKKPPTSAASALSAAAALMGKTKISSMFTSSAFQKRSDDKIKAMSCDSIVDDVIAEFAPDDADRERRRSRQSINLGLGSSPKTSVRIEKPAVGNMSFAGGSECENKAETIYSPLTDLGQDSEKTDHKEPAEELNVEGDSKDLGKAEVRQDENVLRNGDVRGDNVADAVEVKADVKLENGEEKVFSLNATVKDNKEKPFTATAEWEIVRSAGNADVEVVDSDEKSEFALDSDGSLPFYIIDAHEENYGVNMGTLYLFGKVKAGCSFHSCCIVVKNNDRCIFAIPQDSVFNNEEVVRIEKDKSESKISTEDFLKKLQNVASGLKNEVKEKLMDLNVSRYTMTPVKRNYAFERSDIPAGENYVLKVNYSFKDPPLPSDLKGETFSAVLGTHTSALELFLVKRKIKGPSWLSVSKFSSCHPHQRVTWCKFEIIVDRPKDICVMKNPPEVPPIVVTAINLKTIINEKQNMNEIISASIISCSKVKIDTPMVASEWKRPAVLNQLTVVRKLEGGIFPMGFTKEATDKNSKAGSNVLVYESSERALLNRLMAELYKLDSDVLVGHNISGFDLDILLHRAQACRVPSGMWSKIGRLKRSVMPKLTKGSTIFGSGASPGIMSCIAGRLLCDTYLCSRDLLKEVSYSLTQLSKTQLDKDRKEIAPNEIPKLFQKSEALMELIECNETDAWLSMELMFHLSILPLTRQMTNISGNLWGKTLQGARAQRVEYLLLHAFHAEKYIVPDKYSSHGKENKSMKKKEDHAEGGGLDDTNLDNEVPKEDHAKGKKGSAYAGGLVLEPKRGLYDRYILLLDFNSLYPSIIQEYNICFTTVERSCGGAVPRIPSCNRTGVLPKLLKNLVETRKRVKSWLKSASGLKAQQLDIQQQALKLTANSMYGCLGFSNSRFYAKPLAELITLQGREILQSTVDLVQNNLNLEVIYGDTDSIMIYSGLDDIAKAKAIAGKVIQEVNKKYRCLEIDLDGLYKRMLLLKKKKYAALKVQFRNGQLYEIIERKGLDMVRRDWSLLSKEQGDFCLDQILSGGSCEDVVESIHSSLMKVQEEMRHGKVELEKYIITKSLTKPPEAYPDAKNQPHVQVALRLKQNGYSTGCSAGDTVPYIICCEEGSTAGTKTGMAQRARHPDELKRDNGKWMIDIDYYLSQQIYPVVSRLCACIQGTSPARLADCLGLDSSKFQSKTSEATSDNPSPLLLCSADDEDRYHGCEPLTLSCPSCSNTFDCPRVFSSICKQTKEQSKESPCDFWRRLRCHMCPEEGDVGRLSPMMIANQVKKQAERFIIIYYTSRLTCDDETCKYTTRSLNLRVIGDSERGTVCPNYPRCNGRLVRQYSEADLYKQLTYFCFVLDTVRCIEKIDIKERIPFEKEMARIRLVVDPAATSLQKLRDRCAYGWVQLKDLFSMKN